MKTKSIKSYHPLIVTLIAIFISIQSFAGVEPDGSYTHVIPIEIPKGINGVQPNLALKYNSNAGNGMLGVGWSLVGLPTITRMNWGKGIKYNGTDTYMGPEGRLIDVGDGTFRAENDKWSKYVPDYNGGACNNEPCSWTVYDKTGNKLEFGVTEDSRIEAVGKDGSVRIWALNRFEEVNGNSYSVLYAKDPHNGDYYPERINYADFSIVFILETRPDTFVSYGQGSRVLADKRLETILVRSNTLELTTFQMTYIQTISNKSLLHSLAKQGEIISTFGWQGSNFGFGEKKKWISSVEAGNRYPRWVGSPGTYADLKDMNGDGLPDRITHHDYDTGKGSGLFVAVNNGNGFDEKQKWISSVEPGNRYPRWTGSPGTYADLIDMNGDGLPDRVTHHDYDTGKGSGLFVAINNGNGFDEKQKWISSVEPGNRYPQWRGPAGVYADLIDMNGDGLPDRVTHHDYDTGKGSGLFVAINEGNGFGEKQKWISSVEPGNRYPQWRGPAGLYADLRDMNGDGLPDRITHHDYDTGKGSGLFVAINNGNGFDEKRKWISSVEPGNRYPRWRGPAGLYADLRDMNGDGLPDRVTHHDYDTGKGSGLFVAINNGNGFDEKQKWISSVEPGNRYPQWRGPAGVYADLIDMNGDGQPDRVTHHDYDSGKGSGLFVAINNGNGFDEKQKWIGSIQAGNRYPQWTGSPGIYANLIDMNGDGLPDRVTHHDYDTGKGSGLFVAINEGKKIVVIDVKDNKSKNSIIDFKSKIKFSKSILANNFNCNGGFENQPAFSKPCGIPCSSPKLFVSKIEISDGRNSTGKVNDDSSNVDSIVAYDYVNGRYYPGKIQDRKNLGFEKIIEKRIAFNTDGSEFVQTTKITDYRQEALFDFDGDGTAEPHEKSPFTGRPWKITNYVGDPSSDGVLISEDFLTYNDDQTHLFPVPGNKEIAQVLMTQKTTNHYQDGELASTTQEDFTYDQFGRPEVFQFCYKDGETLSDCETTTTIFKNWSIGSAWDAETPEKITKTAGNIILEAAEFDYVDESKPTQILARKKLLCENADTCTSEASGRWVPEKQDVHYTMNGLIEYEKDALGRKTSYTYFVNGLLDTKTIHANNTTYQTSYTYNDRGQVLTETKDDVQGRTSTYEYYDDGRLKKKTNTIGGITEYNYFDGDPNSDGQYKQSIIYQQVGVGDPTLVATKTEEYYDGLGFVYKTKTQGDEDGAGNRPWVIVDHEEFYENGVLVSRSSLPYTDIAKRVWKTTTHDRFGRKVKVDLPTGSTIDFAYILNTDKTSELHINTQHEENGSIVPVIEKQKFDIKAQLIEKTDQLNQVTNFEYNAAGHLTKTILPLLYQNNSRKEIIVTYDSFGRRKSLSDPVLGLTSFEYDDLGNIDTQTDSQNRITRHIYDELNRIKEKRTNYQTADEVLEASYTYDETNGFANNYSRGRLSKVEDQTGTIKFGYDKAGNITVKQRVIDGLSGTYTEEIEYNEFGNPLKYTFPDLTEQETVYTSTGKIKGVYIRQTDQTYKKYASFEDYNAMGQMQRKEFGNGLFTDLNYSNAGQLLSLHTCKPVCDYAGTKKYYQKLAYQFDVAGYVKSIADSRPQADREIMDASGDLIDTDSSQSFEYDYLGRLRKATWSSDNQVIQYNYNELGNIKRRSSRFGADPETFVDYLIDNTGQQVLHGFDDIHYNNKVFAALYDPAGNITHKMVEDEENQQTNWDYRYDAGNRLTKVYKGVPEGQTVDAYTPRVTFTYDYKGQRTSKVFTRDNGSTVKTWYVSPLYEIRRDSNKTKQATTKFIVAGSKGKVAAITKETTAQQTSLLLSDQYIRYAGLLDAKAVENFSEIASAYVKAYLVHPKSVTYFKTGLQLLMVFLFILIVIKISNSNEKLLKSSSFARWQRYTAASLVCVFFLTSCQMDTGGEQNVNPEDDSGIFTTIPSQKITGDTSNGVPTGIVYYHKNHIGSSSVVTGESGEFKTYIVYDPFGKIAQHRSAGQNTITHKYTSQESDEETDLMYYNARYYDPNIGRFITADTVIPEMDNAQSYNRYAYVVNNPIQYTDPSGHSWLSDAWEGFKSAAEEVADAFGHELTKAYHATQHEFVNHQTLRMVGMIVATSSCGPWCAAAYSAWIAKSAGASDADALKLAVISGVSAYFNSEISSMDNGFLKVTARGVLGGSKAAALGGDFKEGFVLSAHAELASWGISEYVKSQNPDMKGSSNPTYQRATKPASLKPEGKHVLDSSRNNLGIARHYKKTTTYTQNEYGFFDKKTVIHEVKTLNEGSWAMRATNYVPGMNSMSVFHDSMAITNTAWNVASIPLVAMPIHYYSLGWQSDAYTDDLAYGSL